MINIILILLLFQILSLIIFKPKHNTLGCGIFAWAGSNPKSFNKAKFDILGLYNNSRGGDSCGVTTDGEIYYGLTTNKNYYDFLIEKEYLKPKEVPVVFGHTRRTSVGAANEYNAHPFGFGELKEGYSFIGCHNGTLTNHGDLAKEYGVIADLWEMNENGTRGKWIRSKNDSEILLECIYNSKDIKVLDSYIGGAALVFQDLTEPDTVYAFHGASRKETSDTNPDKFEERPLYYYKESKNSLYISSLEEPLIAIGGKLNKNIFEFKHNIVYKIKNGDIDSAVTYKVDRSKAAQKKSFITSHNKNFTMAPMTRKIHTATANCTLDIDTTKKRSPKQSKSNYKLLDNSIITNIYDETDDKYFKSGINFRNLRYRRNGHLINGVYTFIFGYGFFHLADDSNKAMAASYELLDRFFDMDEGRFLNGTETPDFKSGNIVKPFTFKKQVEPPLIYFHKGVMLETSMDYEAVTNKFKDKYTFLDLSEMSKHPIIDLNKKRKPDHNQEITYNRLPYTKKHSFLQSGKIYNIEKGNLINIEICESSIDLLENSTPIILGESSEIKLDVPFKIYHNTELKKLGDIFDVNQIKTEHFIDHEDIFSDIEHIARNSQIDEDPKIEEEIEYDSEIKDTLESEMMNVYITVQNANNSLAKHSANSDVVTDVMEVNNDYLMNLDSLIIDKIGNNK
jgi:hypothetical protein